MGLGVENFLGGHHGFGGETGVGGKHRTEVTEVTEEKKQEGRFGNS